MPANETQITCKPSSWIPFFRSTGIDHNPFFPGGIFLGLAVTLWDETEGQGHVVTEKRETNQQTTKWIPFRSSWSLSSSLSAWHCEKRAKFDCDFFSDVWTLPIFVLKAFRARFRLHKFALHSILFSPMISLLATQGHRTQFNTASSHSSLVTAFSINASQHSSVNYGWSKVLEFRK